MIRGVGGELDFVTVRVRGAWHWPWTFRFQAWHNPSRHKMHERAVAGRRRLFLG